MSPDSDITILNIKNLKNTASHLQLFFRVQKDAAVKNASSFLTAASTT
ncbi:hypothetical protein N577_015995 [Lacticaseibacillus rhamnosus 2166]|uniref:Uncharacterized protein n=1 Tax=Lacticaseibacillus rhamnosus (strain LMS2-1) TaxID=525361 RepID=C2JU67_LACRM|nr:conserved hypothetical protein [Lacticaseibacillus rhamnosus ATCC 8530]EEN81460.1 hypothetical protein HMPREF0539_0451 [Lacticaseibacillus rhamnosus LMS2-1]ETW67135.1 hypothetical protein N577_015995 [Lacticaseibacillus rhamnosus 2166]